VPQLQHDREQQDDTHPAYPPSHTIQTLTNGVALEHLHLGRTTVGRAQAQYPGVAVRTSRWEGGHARTAKVSLGFRHPAVNTNIT
jgi:hypothetical protein